MLTDEQKKTLTGRNDQGVTANRRADIVYRYTRKLKDRLDELGDANYLIGELPPTSVRETVAENHLMEALDLVEKLLELLDPWPVAEHENGGRWAFKTYGSKFPDYEPGKCGIQTMSRTASNEEIELHQRLKNHLNKLQHYVDPCIPDPICRGPEYAREMFEKTKDILKEHQIKMGGSWSVSLDNYNDEWLGKDNWVERKPSLVDIETLNFMRWKPKGIKNCMELPSPPLLTPRNDVPPGEGKSFTIHVKSVPPKEEPEGPK